MIKDEVEPIGGFVGDAFIQPVFLLSQALTALVFIMAQSVWLGSIALIIVLAQAIIIPILRKEQLRLGRERQIASRQLAGRIGEIVDAGPTIQGHGATTYVQSDIAGRLGRLFDIRYALYKRKFAVKFLNNLLAQVTPFFFYAIGGYLRPAGPARHRPARRRHRRLSRPAAADQGADRLGPAAQRRHHQVRAGDQPSSTPTRRSSSTRRRTSPGCPRPARSGSTRVRDAGQSRPAAADAAVAAGAAAGHGRDHRPAWRRARRARPHPRAADHVLFRPRRHRPAQSRRACRSSARAI